MQQLNKIFTQVRATPFEDSCKAKKCSIVLWERSFPKALLNIVNFFFFFLQSWAFVKSVNKTEQMKSNLQM